MEVKVVLNLDELKKRLCKDCQEVMNNYLKELAVQQLLADTQKEKKLGK